MAHTAHTIADLSNLELLDLMRHGHPIEPSELDDSEYRGISLGLPAPLIKLSWLKFMKTFHRDPSDGGLRGWNVRVEQDGVDTPCTPLQEGGRDKAFGHYKVVRPTGYAMPTPCYQGLMIDYGLGGNGRFDPLSRARDPIVAVHAGSVELLLGWTYLDLGVRTLATPSFFTLERLGALRTVVAPPR